MLDVRTKCLFDSPSPEDGERILVTRWMSRGGCQYDRWLRMLAPSVRLLKRWKAHELTWEQFAELYEAEMVDQKSTIGWLRRLAEDHRVTLLCYEVEKNPHCHRHVLKDLIEGVSS